MASPVDVRHVNKAAATRFIHEFNNEWDAVREVVAPDQGMANTVRIENGLLAEKVID